MIQYQALSKRRLPNMVHVSLLHNEKKDLTVMVNNSTNINKTNNHLSHCLTEHKKNPQHLTLEIKVLAWDSHRNVARLNLSMGSPAWYYRS
jgi:hypothetical protein